MTPAPARPDHPLVAGLIAIPVSLASAAIAGWVLHVDVLFTLGTRTAMQMNTAVGILLLAAALRSDDVVRGLRAVAQAIRGLRSHAPADARATGWLDRDSRLVGLTTGSAAAALGALTLAEWVFGVHFGIDTLLLTPHLVPPNGIPGRMAWQSALNFTLLGVAAAFWHLHVAEGARAFVAGVLGSIVTAVAMFVISGGLVVQGGLIDWSAWTTVAVGTGASMLVLSGTVLHRAWHLRPIGESARWAPVGVLVALTAMGALLASWLHRSEYETAQQTIRDYAEETAARIHESWRLSDMAMQRMVQRWQVGGGIAPAVWDADARAYTQDLGFVYLWYVDRGARARFQKRDGAAEPGEFAIAVRDWCHALGATSGQVAHHATIVPGEGPGVMSLFRLQSPDGFEGCIGALRSLQEALRQSAPQDHRVAMIAAIASSDLAYVSDSGSPASAFVEADKGPVHVGVAPTEDFLSHRRSWAPELTLLSFMFVAVISAIAVRQSQASAENRERLIAEIAATNSVREQAALVLENSGQGFWDWDVASGDVTLDDTWHRLMGYAPGEIADGYQTWRAGIHPDDRRCVFDVLDRHLRHGNECFDIDYRGRRKDGSWTWLNTRGRVQARGPEGLALRMIGTIQDVSTRKRAEQLTAQSLREKEVLLREIHHRVKNNLAVISSLFYFQEHETTDPAAIKILKVSQDRTRSMAMVHELLYRSTDLSRIDFADYLKELVRYLQESYGSTVPAVLEIEPILMSVDIAVPCGLIVNELVTNVFKHAYPQDHQGPVGVRAARLHDRVVITVADTGPGIPAGLDPATSRSLGLRLVRSLVEQLDGTVAFRAKAPGTEVRLEFPLLSDEGSPAAAA